ncbi:hypothetical protein CANARDRAFT_5774 [[Candida] arabinofermentans NRRL YB-2248]|uniref:CMP/dCMP-type deaminase domain-containing protein n=1 Tax=[Candida] arabinofermentans NRRL YB-2248 TaxID=983967 RepID=A0A1E4T678_9ASCO|nr:hypothetical protein CANARDRAFT_5774 [[Candida] arabinofermentans NRRL YB-2248]
MGKNEIPVHYFWMKEALKVAEEALTVKEVPVACIYVYKGKIIARGFNQTNITLNGTRHAEFEGFKTIRELYPESFEEVLKETDLYVTVEPCIMCASLLRQIQIRRVFFGCANERFGGNGSVFKVNNDFPKSQDIDREKLKRSYTVYPGILNKDAVIMLRKFYLLENEKSPNLKDKKYRKLELQEFPILNYSSFLTKSEFTMLFGKEYEFIYDENQFLEFNETGELTNEATGSGLKRVKLSDNSFNI